MSSLVSSLPIHEQTTLDLAHIDSRSKKIVYGYLHRMQSLLLSDDCEQQDDINRSIPRSVYLFCMQLIDDHFMIQQSTHQWTFSGPLLHRMLNAVNEQFIQTDIFEAGKMLWTLEIYPNGDSGSNVGKFHVILAILDMPELWTRVTVRYTIRIKELAMTCTQFRQFDKGERSSWGDERLSFQEFTNSNPDKLTFSVTLRVLQIKLDKEKLKKQRQDEDEDDDVDDTELDDILYDYDHPMTVDDSTDHSDGHYSFEWKIDDELAQRIRNNINNLPRRYESEPICGLWKVLIWPNDTNNRCTLGLMMLGLPNKWQDTKDRDTANVRWSLGIKEGNVFQHKITKFSYDYRRKMHALWDTNILTSTEFQTYASVTICADIQILNLDEDKDAGHMNRETAAAMAVNDEWKEYMAQNKGLEMAFMNRFVSSPSSEDPVDAKQEQEKIEDEAKEPGKEKNAKKREVRKWLKEEVKLPQYYSLFVEQGFDDLECFAGLTFEMMDSCFSGFSDIKKGHRLKILHHIKKLEKILP